MKAQCGECIVIVGWKAHKKQLQWLVRIDLKISAESELGCPLTTTTQSPRSTTSSFKPNFKTSILLKSLTENWIERYGSRKRIKKGLFAQIRTLECHKLSSYRNSCYDCYSRWRIKNAALFASKYHLPF